MIFQEKIINLEPVKDFLSANIKARREVLGISQEKLAELANVSVQMIKRIEGRRSWVGDKMLAKLAMALGVSAFQLLVPAGDMPDKSPLVGGLLRNLRQNIHDDINSRFDRLLPSDQRSGREPLQSSRADEWYPKTGVRHPSGGQNADRHAYDHD